ncbi:MAG: LysM peptidoglycan-binding domain-containing protein, partial [Anaerolineales bacterium]|nr:LysM peptidoglycan-binding domain-containing protein [Anaerolineales bacterium]
MAVPIFILPFLAPGGLVASIVTVFDISQDEEVIATANSQNVPILEAALNHDPNPSKGGGDITVVAGSSLLPDTGPSGTLANIDDRPTSDQISIYVVREGDSLSQIAGMFNVSVNTIVWANDLKRGSLITPGQTLIILPISGVQHTVKKDDTLKSIAKKYKGDFDEILQYNNLDADSKLSVGQVVTIPDGEIAMPTYSTTLYTAGSNIANYSGYYIPPTTGRKTQGLHGYNGIDIGAPLGTPIVASASGTVIIS